MVNDGNVSCGAVLHRIGIFSLAFFLLRGSLLLFVSLRPERGGEVEWLTRWDGEDE